MEAATPLHRTHVRVVGEAILADGLVVTDPRAVRLLSEHDDPHALLLDAIEIGARALELVGTESHAEVVKAEFAGLREAFTGHATRIAERLDEKVAEAFGAEDGEVAKVMARHFGDESSSAVQHKVRGVLMEMSAQMREDLRRQLLAEGDDNPLAKFHAVQIGVARQIAASHGEALARVDQRLEAMRLEVERLRAEKEKLEELNAERERGTAKGRVFEEALVEALDAIALAQGDDCEGVGDVAEGTRKTGDAVVTIGAAAGPGLGRIVFEAKNKRPSKPDMLRELDLALDARRADFAVMVVNGEDKVPARTHELREMQGDKLVVAWDPDDGSDLPLRVAYSLARARVLLARAEGEGIDSCAIRATVERAQQAMNDVQRIKQQLTKSRTAVDEAGSILEVLANAVRTHLDQIERLVAEAGAAQLTLET